MFVKSVEEGGIGMRYVRDFNIALLGSGYGDWGITQKGFGRGYHYQKI